MSCCNSTKEEEPCDYCNSNNKLLEHYIQTPSYYRNRPSGHYYFCSEECKNNFSKEKICRDCNYSQSLKKPEGEDFVLCTEYPFSESCYDKFVKNKMPDSYCSFCGNYSDKLEFRGLVNKKNYYYCNDCFEIYKNVVLGCENPEKKDIGCAFCSSYNEHKVINGYVMCETCFDTYTAFVFGS